MQFECLNIGCTLQSETPRFAERRFVSHDLSKARASKLSKRNRNATTSVTERRASLAELNPVTQEILKANTVDRERDGDGDETAFDLKLRRRRLNKTSIPSKRGVGREGIEFYNLRPAYLTAASCINYG